MKSILSKNKRLKSYVDILKYFILIWVYLIQFIFLWTYEKIFKKGVSSNSRYRGASRADVYVDEAHLKKVLKEKSNVQK